MSFPFGREGSKVAPCPRSGVIGLSERPRVLVKTKLTENPDSAICSLGDWRLVKESLNIIFYNVVTNAKPLSCSSVLSSLSEAQELVALGSQVTDLCCEDRSSKRGSCN